MILKNVPGSEEFDAKVALKCTLEILSDNSLCCLATVDPADGSPYVWTAYYCYSADLRLFVLTSPQSHHGRHLARGSSTAVAVYSSQQPFGSLKRGLQLLGQATPTEGSETAKALALFLRRYPAAASIARHPSELARIEARFYVVGIERVRLFDEPTFGEEVFVDMEVVR